MNNISDKMMEAFSYHGCEYPVRVVNIPGWLDNARISTTNMNDELMKPDGSYVDDEGEAIDETIFFYVEEREIELSEDELVKLILNKI